MAGFGDVSFFGVGILLSIEHDPIAAQFLPLFRECLRIRKNIVLKFLFIFVSSELARQCVVLLLGGQHTHKSESTFLQLIISRSFMFPLVFYF